MTENLDVRFETEHIALRLVKTDDDQEITVQPVETVSLTIADRVVLPAGFQGGGGGTSFLPTATYYDDDDATYFYFGWTAAQTEGEWLVRRANRASLQETDAQQTGNPGYADLDAAWPNRASLTYS